MALHLSFDPIASDELSQSAQTTLTSGVGASDTQISVESTTGFEVGDTIRIKQYQRTIDSIPNETTINLTTAVGATIESGALVSKSNMDNPDTVTISGTTGGTDDKALYVSNDATDKRYTMVSLTAINDNADVEIEYALDESGSPGVFADSISLPNISAKGAGSDTVKIWRKVKVSPGQESQEVVEIKHKITATEYAVY